MTPSRPAYAFAILLLAAACTRTPSPEAAVAAAPASTNIIFVQTLDDQEHIARLFSKYDMLSMPVVDKEQRLVGIITIDDAVDVIQSENTEDFEKMAGMAPSEESYMKSSVLTISKNRIGWISVLWACSLITGFLLEHYESAISALPARCSPGRPTSRPACGLRLRPRWMPLS